MENTEYNRRRPHAITFRASDRERALLKAAADLEGVSRAELCRRAAIRKARAVALKEGVRGALDEMDEAESTTGGI